MQINIIYNNKTKYIVNSKKISSEFEIFIKKYLKPNASIKSIEVGIHFISIKNMQKLNYKFRNIDKPTDVLSFPVYDNLLNYSDIKDYIINLGDIFICIEVAKKQAKQNNISTNKEIEMLSIHGLKHLIGIHHK